MSITMLEEDGRHTQRFASCLLQAYCGFRSGKQGPREVVQRGAEVRSLAGSCAQPGILCTGTVQKGDHQGHEETPWCHF